MRGTSVGSRFDTYQKTWIVVIDSDELLMEATTPELRLLYDPSRHCTRSISPATCSALIAYPITVTAASALGMCVIQLSGFSLNHDAL